MVKGYKFRLEPNETQKKQIQETLDSAFFCQKVNGAIFERRAISSDSIRENVHACCGSCLFNH
ncbi:helix-turn-helix domain-containing protein [Stecheria intestinalis]|uniref:helix-turn-helix domain-containing protein n=1 Tax=Stecheria intestinalis TaxID=2606630 RepID=UPI003C6F46BA